MDHLQRSSTSEHAPYPDGLTGERPLWANRFGTFQWEQVEIGPEERHVGGIDPRLPLSTLLNFKLGSTYLDLTTVRTLNKVDHQPYPLIEILLPETVDYE